MAFYDSISKLDENPNGFNDLYESLERDDPCDFVMKIYEKFKDTETTSDCKTKCLDQSEVFRTLGNALFNSEKFEHARKLFNMAVLYAPKDSFALKVAYSNRSALLFHVQEYKATLKDIALCFEMGCPDSLLEILTARKNKCLNLMWKDNIKESAFEMLSPPQLLRFDKRNSQIPSASGAVEVNMDGPYPTVIAAEEIKPGTLVAMETAFVGASRNNLISCHYCLKMSLNLIPCDDCTDVLFCDNDCKERCLKEYHQFECNLLVDTKQIALYGLTLKAVIKMKNECSSWCEFIQAFENNCSTSNIKNSSIEDIFNNTNKFSLLHTMYDRPVDYGKLFMTARMAAMIIQKLDNRNFFPIEKDRLLAMRATAGVFMHLAMYIPQITLIQASYNAVSKQAIPNFKQKGLFSFIGKLKHSCDPNLLVVSLKNKAVLIALHSIPRGTELTISYLNHHFILDHKNRVTALFDELGCVCSCMMCTEKWTSNSPRKNYRLTRSQKKYLKETKLVYTKPPNSSLNRLSKSAVYKELIIHYHNLCRGLDLFKSLQHTDVYQNIFIQLCDFLLHVQLNETRNCSIIGDVATQAKT